MNYLDEIVFAKKLGRTGFYEGKQAPAQDPEVLDMLKGMKPGNPHGVNLLTAWNEGWNKARVSTNEYKQTFGGQ